MDWAYDLSSKWHVEMWNDRLSPSDWFKWNCDVRNVIHTFVYVHLMSHE